MENYQICKIDNHTWQLENPFRIYLYLLEGEKEALLIDAGNGFSSLKEVVASQCHLLRKVICKNILNNSMNLVYLRFYLKSWGFCFS